MSWAVAEPRWARSAGRGFRAPGRAVFDRHGARCYSEHLSYCADDGQLYDLLPIPFTAAAVNHVATRIARVQDLLGRRIAIENVSYYCAPGAEMSELEFVNAVLERADCALLLDLNNIYVNSINHGYDATAFLRGLPAARIAYAHVAGHHVEAVDLLIDTHGAAVVDPVWDLLAAAYADHGVFPTLLERDFNLPPLDVLLAEVARIGELQAAAQAQREPRVGRPVSAPRDHRALQYAFAAHCAIRRACCCRTMSSRVALPSTAICSHRNVEGFMARLPGAAHLA